MPSPGFEPGSSRPQREILTTILRWPGDIGYRSRHLSHAKRALYHLSYIPLRYFFVKQIKLTFRNISTQNIKSFFKIFFFILIYRNTQFLGSLPSLTVLSNDWLKTEIGKVGRNTEFMYVSKTVYHSFLAIQNRHSFRPWTNGHGNAHKAKDLN